MENKSSQYSNTFPSYLENSVSGPFYHTTIKNDLEGISIDKTPKNEKGFLERLITDKGKSQKATVKALLKEIELRETLDSHLLNNIDNDISRQNTYMDLLKNIKVHYSFELSKNVGKSKAHVENDILELEKEKRKEYLECWRDLMSLKKYLLIALKDYWDFVKRREVLGIEV